MSYNATQVTLNSEGVVVDSTNPLPVTLQGPGASGGATSDNQVAMIAQLDDLITETENQASSLSTISTKATNFNTLEIP